MIAKQVHHPLAPVYDKDCRVLFLGTMPSPQSRADGFYYAHPRNRFWPVLAGILESRFQKEQRQGGISVCATILLCGMCWHLA